LERKGKGDGLKKYKISNISVFSLLFDKKFLLLRIFLVFSALNVLVLHHALTLNWVVTGVQKLSPIYYRTRISLKMDCKF